VDPANVEEIADVICNALGAPAVREKYAKAAYQKVKERFSLESVALQHEDFYTRIASEFNSR
jgi:glycosyltransferase involved in cell wall biosynthesis